MLNILIAYTGLIFGFILSIISPEELKPGKKYFLTFKNLMFGSFLIATVVLFSLQNDYAYIILFGFFTIPFLYLKAKVNSNYKEIGMYALFTIPVFFVTNHQLILLTIIFLYGLPTGTLLRLDWIEKQER